jgi:predicted amino acid racemase
VFLDALAARNPALLDAAADLHRRGVLPPDCYVIDRDAVAANAALLAAAGRAAGLRLWFVAKQFGRNPELIRAITEHLPAAAAIDLPEARVLRAAGAFSGNLGHLVQIPAGAVDEAVSWSPEAITVFDLDNARRIGAAAHRRGIVQPVLIRLAPAAEPASEPGLDSNSAHPGQEGGVPAEDPYRVLEFAAELARLDGVRPAGVTAFPCLHADPGGPARPTENLRQASRARLALERAGHGPQLLSAPGVNSVSTLPLLAEYGATHAEPGHALTGTTPLHTGTDDTATNPEIPALLYLTEIAHTLPDGRPAVFGGGFYPRGHARTALVVGRDGGRLRLPVEPQPAVPAIDYYRLLGAPPPGVRLRAGDPALLCFRTQIFTTRSTVAVLAGLGSGRVRVAARHDALGRPLGRPLG